MNKLDEYVKEYCPSQDYNGSYLIGKRIGFRAGYKKAIEVIIEYIETEGDGPVPGYGERCELISEIKQRFIE